MAFFALKAANGKFVSVADDPAGTLAASADLPLANCIFELIHEGPEVVRLRPFFSDYYVRQAGPKVICADAWPTQAHPFLLQRLDGNGYALCGQGWLGVGEDGRIVGDRPDAGDAETFELVDQAEIVEACESQVTCCGVVKARDKRPDPSLMRWDDKGHRGLLDSAIEILERLGDGKVNRLIALFKHREPKEGVAILDENGNLIGERHDMFRYEAERGLHDADYVWPYTLYVYSRHFYDPATKRNYRWMAPKSPNALTECKRFANQAFKKLNAAGWEPKPFGSPGYEAQKSACYDLGLALHYFTDLTQPMHAANFANVIGFGYANWKEVMDTGDRPSRKDWRHAEFEEEADRQYEGYARKLLEPAVMEQAVRETKALVRSNLHDIIVETAWRSKGVFDKEMITNGGLPPIGSPWVPLTLEAIFDITLPYAQKATAAFIATWCSLSGTKVAAINQLFTGAAQRAGDHMPSFVEWREKGYVFCSNTDTLHIYYIEQNMDGSLFVLPRKVHNGDSDVAGLYLTQNTPAVALLGDVPYVVWHGHKSNDIYFSRWQAGDDLDRQWSRARKISDRADIRPGTAPALVAYKRRLFAFWSDTGARAPGKAAGGYYSRYDPVRDVWEEMKALPGSPTRTPAAAVFDGRIVLVWPDASGYLLGASYDWGQMVWRPAPQHQSLRSAETPALVEAAGVLHLFWKDRDGKVAAAHSTDALNWSAPERIDVSPAAGLGAGVIGNKLFVGWNEKPNPFSVTYFSRQIDG